MQQIPCLFWRRLCRITYYGRRNSKLSITPTGPLINDLKDREDSKFIDFVPSHEKFQRGTKQ